MNILMTGCSRSVGKYIATNLKRQGHEVFRVGVDGPDHKVDFNLAPPVMQLVAGDIVSRAVSFFSGPPDCLINNAGMTYSDFIPHHSVCKFQTVMAVNVFMPFALIQACVKCQDAYDWCNLTETNPFRVINTGSMCIKLALRAAAGYTASKAALHAITRVVAKEAAGKYPLCAITISPGAIADTDMIEQATKFLVEERGMTEEQAKAYSCSSSPLGRPCSQDELWQAFDFCVNRAPMYMSGSNLELPGASGNF